MATLTMKIPERPDGDLIELPNVGLFSNGEATTLEDWQVTALDVHYGLQVKTSITFPLKAGKEVTLNLTGEQAVVQETKQVDEEGTV